MLLIVNGETKELEARTIEDVIVLFGLKERPVVVEADGEIIAKEQWPDTEVRPRMKIELVHFVGGG
ncbi:MULTISPECIES: sulfur carrier protein ThiS [unclassified Paenibacillus]|uniref:sulfur carrier protein ThiS n=1 Tax=unclassified Paenibacillus TaxID=185978 RepID=UPI001050284C|nr:MULTISPECIES: sulfur carrier protein ThiS [unclassified Paenibacillus]NIK70678.1 sulfur carrier protein [Paenibacillus sp. BK720]TCM93349.1 sulfur carrier protein [Paenibacillus sp. BK033]